MGRPKAYSEDTAQRIDEEVKRIVSRGYDAARAILEANLPVLHAPITWYRYVLVHVPVPELEFIGIVALRSRLFQC